MGRNSFINYGVFFDLSDTVSIGENVNIAMQVSFITSTHEISDGSRRAGKTITAPIVVENGCWIGAKAVLLPGVTVHSGCVIGAGSLVTKDCSANSIYVGVPAVKVREIVDICEK